MLWNIRIVTGALPENPRRVYWELPLQTDMTDWLIDWLVRFSLSGFCNVLVSSGWRAIISHFCWIFSAFYTFLCSWDFPHIVIIKFPLWLISSLFEIICNKITTEAAEGFWHAFSFYLSFNAFFSMRLTLLKEMLKEFKSQQNFSTWCKFLWKIISSLEVYSTFKIFRLFITASGS